MRKGDRVNVNDVVTVKTDGEVRREGVILAVEPFQEGTMYLIALDNYPEGIWFFNELNSREGVFVEPRRIADK
ncbi:protein DsrB [Dickeya sp. ws52]|nr:protein DsrB [Dickeya sp. ws52]